MNSIDFKSLFLCRSASPPCFLVLRPFWHRDPAALSEANVFPNFKTPKPEVFGILWVVFCQTDGNMLGFDILDDLDGFCWTN